MHERKFLFRRRALLTVMPDFSLLSFYFVFFFFSNGRVERKLFKLHGVIRSSNSRCGVSDKPAVAPLSGTGHARSVFFFALPGCQCQLTRSEYCFHRGRVTRVSSSSSLPVVSCLCRVCGVSVSYLWCVCVVSVVCLCRFCGMSVSYLWCVCIVALSCLCRVCIVALSCLCRNCVVTVCVMYVSCLCRLSHFSCRLRVSLSPYLSYRSCSVATWLLPSLPPSLSPSLLVMLINV